MSHQLADNVAGSSLEVSSDNYPAVTPLPLPNVFYLCRSSTQQLDVELKS